MEESQLSSPQHLVNQITEIQTDLLALRSRRAELEEQLAGVNEDIDADVERITELRQQLDAAISSATHKAVG